MEWISVKDRLPEKDMVCLVWNDSRPFQFYVSIYVSYFKEFEVSMIGGNRLNDPICFNATHWAEIKAPDEQK